jgi:hypothetical protein
MVGPNGKQNDNPAVCTILQKIKIDRAIFISYFRLAGLQSMLLRRKDLVDFRGVRRGQKKGGPHKNDERSQNVIENKRARNFTLPACHDLIENEDVSSVLPRC